MASTKLRTVALTLLAVACAAAGLAAALVSSGVYNVAANRQHLKPVYQLLDIAMRQSVRYHARGLEPPRAADEAMLARGAQCYRQHCVQCHGGPGVAQGAAGQGMQPLPGPLIDATQRWSAGQLYWLTRNGLKMTGMPSWEFRLSEDDLWAVVAFVQKMPQLSPPQFAAMAGQDWVVGSAGHAGRDDAFQPCRPPVQALRPGDAVRGQRALYQYACVGCHTVAGQAQASPQVGPPLDGMARRTRIAGVLDNTPDNMVRWLVQTDAVKPGTAMPAMGVAEQDARDIAAYLAGLR